MEEKGKKINILRKDIGSWWVRKSIQEVFWKITAYTIIIIGSCVILVPLVWMVSTSLKEQIAVFHFPPQWIPNPVRWDNYIEIWTVTPFFLFIRNTCVITFTCIIGILLSTSIIAYGFARLKAPGRDFLFIIVLGTMMLPFQVTMIPTYILFRYLGWIDTFKPLILPFFLGAGCAFYIFLLRQFFLTIPLELDDAAKIDGCSIFGIYWHIILPLSKPALITVAIFSFMWHWNDFLAPLIYLNTEKNFTLTLGLNYFQGLYTTYWHLLMAASTLALIPCLVIFFFAQKYFIQGVVITGLKG